MAVLNKADRITAKRKAEAEEKRKVRLNPAFPFRIRPFNPDFFGLRPTLTVGGQRGSSALR